MTGPRARLLSANAVCVLSGAGISSESGLPTFRGAGGLWRTHRVEELASAQGFAHDPQLVWTWYNERRAAHARAQPNAAHTALAEFERLRDGVTIVTQNVDSLHLRAGSQNVLELHGHLRSARCDRCDARFELAGGMPPDRIEHACGGRFRPDIVWFGEPLPADTWARAVEAALACDVMLVVGTSGMVNPAAALATHYGRDAYLIEVNPEPTAITPFASAVVRASAAETLPQLLGIPAGQEAHT